jgi:methyl coenzyme M reductase subunit C-like uncharacterized protein (methanogenesis marker protein 7)
VSDTAGQRDVYEKMDEFGCLNNLIGIIRGVGKTIRPY